MHRETSTVISVFVSKHAHREPGLSQCINYVRHLRHETEPSLQTELGALDHRTEIDTDLTPIYLLGLSLCWRKHLFCGVYAHCIYSHARRYLRYAIRVCGAKLEKQQQQQHHHLKKRAVTKTDCAQPTNLEAMFQEINSKVSFF